MNFHANQREIPVLQLGITTHTFAPGSPESDLRCRDFHFLSVGAL